MCVYMIYIYIYIYIYIHTYMIYVSWRLVGLRTSGSLRDNPYGGFVICSCNEII